MAATITYILSCWRHCQYVSGCVESIAKQEAEIILFREKCFHVEPKALCIYDSKRKGQVARLNEGLELAETDYIAFMGVDDYLVEGSLDKVRSQLASYPLWLYGSHWQLTKDGRSLLLRSAQPFDLNRLKRQNYIAGGAAFIRTDVARELKFKDVLGLGGDHIMWYRLGQLEEPVVVNFPVYVERLGTSHIRRPGTRALRRFLVRMALRRMR